jgi:sulfotransferase
LIVHFISGLPRSGSTLLAAILKQNPRFYHLGISSPVGSLFTALMGRMGADNESAIFLSNDQRRAIFRGVFENYYGWHAEKAVIDTNRRWCSKISALADIFPAARTIACVRQMGHVIDSIERLTQKNALEPSAIFKFDPSGNVYSRAEALSKNDGLVGFAWSGLKEAYYGSNADKLMLLRYETLTSDPEAAVDAVYDFLGEERFAHDFDNVEQPDAAEHDARLGVPGLHAVRPKVENTQRLPVLPPDLFARCQADNFWENDTHNVRKVRVV